ncbi:MAG: NADP-dependent malic enzyme, partial [Acidobacteria bacterium]|nr:NADP-dependent malic enzyme [Acidobacteriota bacterium]
HGTAIISAAALINALEIAGKKLDEVRVVFSGAGAAALGCVRLYLRLGLSKENVLLCDSRGVVHTRREDPLPPDKAEFARETELRTLADALEGADVFVGVSVAGIVTPEMLRTMAPDPIVFAMANPDPEISYEEARKAREDVILATGRSDFPNQVNNVLGFPFIFRGALDVRARQINDGMVQAAVQALADLAKEDVPDSVLKAYGLTSLRFGRDYLIPKPFDHRVLLRVAPAVARAAVESGVAQRELPDEAAYLRSLEVLISRRLELMRGLIDRARRNPKRVVFPEGEQEKVLRAAKILVDQGIAHPILLARREVIADRLRELDLPEEKLTIIHVMDSEKLEPYAEELHRRRRREGVTLQDARRQLRSRNYFGAMMVAEGDAEGLISGLTQEYPDTIRPALQVIGTEEGVRRVAGAFVLILKDRLLVFADTTVNIEPSAEDLAEIALLAA